MQISRHWRMNSNRYRLEGVRYANGAVSIQERPAPVSNTTKDENVSKVQEVTPNVQSA
jgi:20S proteasome alpha/beta subunit